MYYPRRPESGNEPEDDEETTSSVPHADTKDGDDAEADSHVANADVEMAEGDAEAPGQKGVVVQPEDIGDSTSTAPTPSKMASLVTPLQWAPPARLPKKSKKKGPFGLVDVSS